MARLGGRDGARPMTGDRWPAPVVLSLVCGVGRKGVRDPEFPCAEFDPGPVEVWASCMSDGHYLCLECRHLSPESERAHGAPRAAGAGGEGDKGG